MREIKFRGKVKIGNRWIVGAYNQNSHSIARYDGNHQDYNVDDNTVGKFTGLKDKNGKEIYEGDIVLQIGYNNKLVPMVVRFENGAFIVGYHNGSSTRKTPMLLSSKCEVTGNIFDNPELLEEKK